MTDRGRKSPFLLCFTTKQDYHIFIKQTRYMITKALYDKLNHLATLTRITTSDAKELQAAIKLYINPTYSVCLRCVQQLKHGQRIIKNYLANVEVIENIPPVVEETLMDEIIPLVAEPEVDEVEADKVGCTKCKRKKQNKG